MDTIRDLLAADPRIAFALAFGSVARGTAHAASDLDVAVGLAADAVLDHRAVGSLIARLERATGRSVDLVILDEAPSPLAYRVFRDGVLLFEHDHAALVECKTRAILEYLDFQPVEALCARGVLRAAADGR